MSGENGSFSPTVNGGNGSFLNDSSNSVSSSRSARSATLTSEQVVDLSETFETIDVSGNGYIEMGELQNALKLVGMDLPGYKVRELIERFTKRGNRDNLSLEEFDELYKELNREKNFAAKFTENIKGREGIITLKGQASQSDQIVHSIRIEEQRAFSDWINTNLLADSDLQALLPIMKSGDDLYDKVKDGLIICKLINLAVPETIDERALNKKNLSAFTKRENQTLALNSALAIGCNIVNIDADDLAKGKPHLVLGLLWQIIRIGLFSQIDLIHVPGLFRLLREGETLDDLRKLSPEEILMRWVNYHLEQADVDRRLNNFTTNVQDSVIYTHLMKQIAPTEKDVSLAPLSVQGGNKDRAEAMLREAEKLDCRSFVTPDDVANGVYKLNLAFVANLFNTWPGLKPPGADEDPGLDVVEETREEKTYRNWMNSMGVDPYVNYIYSDLQNGVVIFQLYDVIRPKMVDWKRVVKKFHKLRGMMDQIQNCNYAVELGRQLRFSLVGIQGKDLYDGNQTLTLALVWQLMRAYTLTILAQCTKSGDSLASDPEIIKWVNQKLSSSGKESQIRSFNDSSIANSRAVLDLIDAIQPGTINYELFRDGNDTDSNLANAKYAITCGRKIGAKIYALPEDIVEVKKNMVMTVFACLMARSYIPNMRETNGDGC